MSDRDALRSMLIYAQREAESLELTSVAHLLSLAVAEAERAHAAGLRGSHGERFLRADVAEADFHEHFGTRRLQ